MMFKILFIIFMTPLIAKDIYFTRSGAISFFSSTPIEDIKANNEQATCVLDMETGSVSFRIPIRGFIFKNSLMQEHFNENYLESDKFPYASFKGQVNDWGEINLSKDYQSIEIKGMMNIHGVSQKITEVGRISLRDGRVIGNSIFKIKVADYGIEIPKLVRENIAKVMEINIDLDLKKK